MSKQNMSSVSKRLWDIISMIRNNDTRTAIIAKTNSTYRNIVADIARIKRVGLQLKYSRNTDKYSIYWPKQIVSLNFTHEEFFYILYIIRVQEDRIPTYKEISKKMELAISEETDPIYDCVSHSNFLSNIDNEIQRKLLLFKSAIFQKHKTMFHYTGQNKVSGMRVVHPYKLIHTPISWYLVAYCEDRKAFRNFKLARMKDIKVTSTPYKQKDFDIEEHRGDAWWLQFNPNKIDNPYKIKIAFKNEAKQAVKEYKFHKSQKVANSATSTIVTWELSYLEEFASWLLQWLGNFEILECNELKIIINRRISNYKKL